MQAIILAAGMGKRLKELTENNTKCMIKVNGVTLIDRMLHQIEKHHLSRIVIVVGYEGQKLINYINTLGIETPIIYINNPVYDKTNNIYSLALAKEWLCREDTLLFESDLIFEGAVLDLLLSDSRDTLALVDKYESWMDGTCVKLADDDTIEAFVPGSKFEFEEIKDYYKTVNVYKFSKEFSNKYYVPFLEAYQSALGENEYYEQVLRVITMLDKPVIKAKRLTGQRWYEIDDIQDLDIAESIFLSDETERVKRLQSRYGGYWRYPRLLDFCYLVNPYYPPEKMKDEVRANFDTLLTSYPSGMRVNCLLAAKNFGVHSDNIVVGNGAAELIKALMGLLKGKTGFIRPTFDEYPNRYYKEQTVNYIPDNRDYSYTADDIMQFFSDKDIRNIIIVNPDNPSGNYIPKADLIKLIHWADSNNLKIIIDESFADFADEDNNTLIEQNLLNKNKHLYVMKSISKSYGVPGLRLGVLASGDTETISFLQKDVAIWNINSFAEFYMQIEEKYKKNYETALIKLKSERKRFEKELAKIKGIRVIPSQANFIMVELENSISTQELLKALLVRHNLLIKELTTKTNGRNYLRLAVRNTAENDMLIKAVKFELGDIQ
ncbi:aminotransferase class I/II-fold pyridoxal phosphate-dependent enzyme [uncultured Succiniclasticum sp.]|jgi:histidinol-phosphate/aromatic aminotransferase/cobyric acid decarboxylase-like protein|uniref:aminotransferase class I/II-fold pyridoxal phosphate-dependent enzyme n=1 Tax=uncultured Succiniclasticum sp. TaxID=1500547 RepID=UPI0025E8361F|nr:aminotransferase class I/II-fold pyridoxal phosphate-dependent enzyme [uncultured Succiniclasticum sp.]